MTPPTGATAPAPMDDAPAPVKPRLRGWLHLGAAVVMLVLGPLLVAQARGPGMAGALTVYAVSIVALFGVSAAFHRVTWGPVGRRRMRRADHATIFVAIAGTYTAVAGLALGGWAQVLLLSVVWGGAAVGVTLRQLWLDAPKWAVALPYVVVGWSALLVAPQLVRGLSAGGFGLVLAGGLAYTAGALVYARKRPNPWPSVFGYHEVFHACTIVGAGLHLAAVAFYAVPRA